MFIKFYKHGIFRLKFFFKLYILKNEQAIAIKKWSDDNGDKTLRLNYSLDEQSIVFDVGGYEGEFAQRIYDKYGCSIYIFEPVRQFYDNIVKRFSGNKKIKVYHCGLGPENSVKYIALNQDGSSIYGKRIGKKERATIVDIFDIIAANNIREIDLIKINIEGGEYDLLNRMIEKNLVSLCNNIQIQFHNVFSDAREKRERIRKILCETHRLTYDYFFVWENWGKIR